jgi:hypothetical protein
MHSPVRRRFPAILIWLIHWDLSLIRFFIPASTFRAVLGAARDCLRTRAALQMEVLASSPSPQRAAALGETTQADRCRSISLGSAVAVLVRLEVCPGHRETGDSDPVAPAGVSTVLDLEGAPRPPGATAWLAGNAGPDSPNESGESALARTAHSRRTAQAGHRHRGNECWQVCGARSQATVARWRTFL